MYMHINEMKVAESCKQLCDRVKVRKTLLVLSGLPLVFPFQLYIHST